MILHKTEKLMVLAFTLTLLLSTTIIATHKSPVIKKYTLEKYPK